MHGFFFGNYRWLRRERERDISVAEAKLQQYRSEHNISASSR